MSGSIGSVERAIDILEQLSQSPQPMGPTKLAQRTQMDKSTAFRLLSTLTARGITVRRRNGSYSLGPRLLSMVSNYLNCLELTTQAYPFLHALTVDLRLPACLAVRIGNEAVVVKYLRPDSKYDPDSPEDGQYRIPVYSTAAGKCLLTSCSGEDLSRDFHDFEFFPYTPHTLLSFDDLRSELRLIRKQGFAVSREEYVLGVTEIASPIYDYRGDVIAAVSVYGAGPFSLTHERLIIEAVKGAARLISEYMGYFE